MKRGFTLIELLAVIVILAIIALIAVPIVINIINDAKKESLQRSIDLYMDTVQKRITQENMKVKYDPDRCDIQDNGNVKCYSKEEIIKTSTGEEELKIEMNGKKPESGTITFKTTSTGANNNNIDTDSNKITYSGVVLEGMEYTSGKQPKEYVPPTPATGEDYRGYYADVDGDGEADGVIYADLNKSESGQYYNSNGAYTYDKATGELNEYTISKEKYTGEKAKFGEKEIIKLKKNKNNPRFYVMALEDFTTEAYTDPNDSNNNYPAYTTYYWYKEAYNHMSPLITSNDFGEGKENTRKMIAKWNAAGTSEGYTDSPQNNRDIWKHIQTKYQQGWYIPSRGEWAAFADYFTNKTDLETKLTTSNYNITYGLTEYYWSSSQGDAGIAWFVSAGLGRVDGINVYYGSCVRLGVTF